ncbi:hypothetical protein [Sphingobacterium tabacisoli]|uniref:TonB-dependent receptor plug domain-containing protein n=1 Tax=Sphingobacterium tabacisoli TaxID=2044855 RepID=A0ABW5L0U1_9SPHI|nr:hypothetical protein [Sphingobacterium tabacisoli]
MRFFISLLVLLNAAFIYGQEKGSEYIESQFNQSYKIYNEWVYCHVNKNDFLANEDLYFQGYVLKEGNNFPSPFATNLIVDVINDKGKVVKQKIFYVENGIAPGQIALSDLPSGGYKFVAYTNWMRNFVNKNAFTSTFNIFKDQKQGQMKSSSSDLKVRLHAEGNTSLAGVEQKWYVGLENWNNELVKMVIEDDKMHPLATLELSKPLSTFFLATDPARQYKCNIFSKDGKLLTSIPLTINESGVSLAANIFEPQYISLEITRGKEQSVLKSYYLAIHAGGRLFKLQRISGAKNTANIKIPTNELKSGIYHASLFDEEGQLRAERPFFVYAKSDASKKWDIIQEDGKLLIAPIAGETDNKSWNYSLTFIPDNIVYRQFDLDAFAYLYKDIDLGWTNNLNFGSDAFRSNLEEIDELLQLYYSRQFSWPTIVTQNQSSFANIFERGFTMKGEVIDFQQRDIGKGMAILNSMDNSFSLTDSLDRYGKFQFDKLHLVDSSRISLHTEIAQGKKWARKWRLDTIEYHFPKQLLSHTDAPDVELSFIPQQTPPIKQYHLEEVKAKMKLKTNRNIYAGVNDDVFLVNEQSFKKYNSIIDVLRSRFMIQINELNMGALEIKFRGGMLTMDPSGGLQSNNPALVVDGMIVNDMNLLRDLQITDLEEIAINKDGINLLGPAGVNGAIFLKTRSRPLNFDMDQSMGNQEKFQYFITKGYTLPKPYKALKIDRTIPNNVASLHWETGVISASKRQIEIDIKDFPTQFVGVIQAIDNNGNIRSQTYIHKSK